MGMRDVTDPRAEADLRRSRDELAATVTVLEGRNRQLGLITEMVELLLTCTTTVEIGDVIARSAPLLFSDMSGTVYLAAGSSDSFDRVAAWGHAPRPAASIMPADCWGLRKGRSHDTVVGPEALSCAHRGSAVGGSLCVPISAQGETVGLLVLTAADWLPAVPEDTHNLAESIGGHLGLALGNFRMREALRNQSIRDPLTSLYNRRYMYEAIERFVRLADRHRIDLCVVAIDVDHFKVFNDTYGHAAGDEVLRRLGAYLSENVRSEDIACRPGGEEFTLILPYASLSETVERIERLREGIKSINAWITSTTAGLSITVSAGIAAYAKHGTTPDDLLRSSDQALYRAKASGRDRLVVA